MEGLFQLQNLGVWIFQPSKSATSALWFQSKQEGRTRTFYYNLISTTLLLLFQKYSIEKTTRPDNYDFSSFKNNPDWKVNAAISLNISPYANTESYNKSRIRSTAKKVKQKAWEKSEKWNKIQIKKCHVYFLFECILTKEKEIK